MLSAIRVTYLTAFLMLALALSQGSPSTHLWSEFHDGVAKIGRATLEHYTSLTTSVLAQKVQDVLHAETRQYISTIERRTQIEFSVLLWDHEVHPLFSDAVITGKAKLAVWKSEEVTVTHGMVPSFTCVGDTLYPGALPSFPGHQPQQGRLSGWPCFRGGAVAISQALNRNSGVEKNCIVFYFAANFAELRLITPPGVAAVRGQHYGFVARQCIKDAKKQPVINLSKIATCIHSGFSPSTSTSEKISVGLRGVAVFLDYRPAHEPGHDYGVSMPFGAITLNCDAFQYGSLPGIKLCYAALFSIIESEHWVDGPTKRAKRSHP